ncbi:MAG: bifunctional diaminohydroxyphosphoribosylaminopyrimidine deaminase/5-amino-6-(5-phosphoribosylamino)uracil reductase RibD [Gammaproteobacteria bacterium]|nr:MAG: bifunctional diaminohydroxyphosphoribosylaminopyrimidine deaminase/5-amino-6-(5-phosphoribosylamino)uracil reductase RibD [Gammaproteobacteria bacterium]
MTAQDHACMAHALRLAARGLYTAHPNPRVGCVIVQGGEIVGEGWHQRTGEAHAEIHALNEAGERARGATAYVTLEPCCHHGRTPPCTEALIQAGVARVVTAMLDPNPKVAGHGLQQLSAAGISVEHGLMQAEAEKLNRGFVTRMQSGRPFVRVKLAMTLDGRTAAADGESRWISGEAARADVQRLRAESGAILTGINTVLHDDPLLTVRLPELDEAEGKPPLRVVLDSRLRFPPNARMLTRPGHTLVITGALGMVEKNHLAAAEVITLAGPKGKVDLYAALHHLSARHEINDVLVEAGPVLSGALVEAQLVDEFIIYLAPALLGDNARGLLHLPALQHLAQRVALDILDLRAIGRDWRITAKPLYT